ncbi:MAG: PEP-CTERM sorting domain-containing protein [Pseudomonadales bacterium]
MKIKHFIGAVTLALGASSGAYAFPTLDIVVSDGYDGSNDGNLFMDVHWGFGNLPQCASGECITRLDIDLTAGDGESNAKWKNLAIETAYGMPKSDISFLVSDSPDPNDADNSDRNLLSIFFNPADTFDQDNGFGASFSLTGLGGNLSADFFRAGKEVVASAILGDGSVYSGSDRFDSCKDSACARIAFSAAVPEPGSIALLSLGLLGLGLARREHKA